MDLDELWRKSSNPPPRMQPSNAPTSRVPDLNARAVTSAIINGVGPVIAELQAENLALKKDIAMLSGTLLGRIAALEREIGQLANVKQRVIEEVLEQLGSAARYTGAATPRVN